MDGSVVHVTEAATRAENANATELLLAHEFAHIVQEQYGWMSEVEDWSTLDERNARIMAIEGAAVRTERAYTERYRVTTAHSFSSDYRDPYRGFLNDRYRHGLAYAEHHRAVESPDTFYAEAPSTTAAVLRPSEPVPTTIEPSVSVSASGWTASDRTRAGEYVVRWILRSQLPANRSAAAAAGWVGDELVTLSDGDRTAHVLTVVWADESEAAEFERAADEYLSAFADRTGPDRYARAGLSYRLERTGPRVTTLSIGPDAFVPNGTVEANVTTTPAS
ncbi:hypothetical protein ACFQL9_03575 [Halobaculum lipolyticum]|uniref:DUF4157 domain-containing protein n=2 Tax=Halobaculum lipolyticum TaxID=3032001 RepID=A0ABD5WB43_9EURY